MKKNTLLTLILASTVALTLSACSSNQAIKTTDGRTIVTDGKPKVDDDTGLVSFKDAQSGKTEQINRDEISNMSELNN
ncbi:YgdI/YgdR family lipoprotein [Pantoea sp.]|uniref:YgdI/YgdR family lipoprotein n=1 Tax=Pantoea sp. TaxID=69393 RepID=UPI0031DEF496